MKDLDFSFYFLLFNRLKDLYNAFLVIDDVDALEDFGIFPSAYSEFRQASFHRVGLVHTDFADNLIVVLEAPSYVHGVIFPIALWHVVIDLRKKSAGFMIK